MEEFSNKLVIVTSYSIHAEPVVRNRLSSFFLELSKAGWEICLVSPSAGAKDSVENSLPEGISNVKHVEFVEYDRSKFWLRAINEISLSAKLLRTAYKCSPNVVLMTIPSVFLLFFLRKQRGVINVIDVRDLVWEYIPDFPAWKKIVKNILKFFALFSLRKANLLSISNPIELSYLKRHVPGMKHVLVSNGIGVKQFNALSVLRKLPKADGLLRVTYIGNVGLAQNLSTLVQAVAGLPSIEVNIVGQGTDFTNVEKEILRLGASNIFLHGSVPWSQVVAWYEKSDVLYAQLTSDFDTAMPSKLYEYLSTGLPVIYGGCGAAIDILRRFENVDVVYPDRPDELRNILLKKAIAGKSEYSSTNIDIIRENFLRETQVKRLVDELNAVYNDLF